MSFKVYFDNIGIRYIMPEEPGKIPALLMTLEERERILAEYRNTETARHLLADSILRMPGPRNDLTQEQRLINLEQTLSTESERQALAESMANPIQTSLLYQSIGRRFINVDPIEPYQTYEPTPYQIGHIYPVDFIPNEKQEKQQEEVYEPEPEPEISYMQELSMRYANARARKMPMISPQYTESSYNYLTHLKNEPEEKFDSETKNSDVVANVKIAPITDANKNVFKSVTFDKNL